METWVSVTCFSEKQWTQKYIFRPSPNTAAVSFAFVIIRDYSLMYFFLPLTRSHCTVAARCAPSIFKQSLVFAAMYSIFVTFETGPNCVSWIGHSVSVSFWRLWDSQALHKLQTCLKFNLNDHWLKQKNMHCLKSHMHTRQQSFEACCNECMNPNIAKVPIRTRRRRTRAW